MKRAQSIIGRKMRTLRRMPLRTLALLPCAWVLLGLARIAILTVQFRRIAPLLGTRADLDYRPPRLADALDQRALRIGQVVRLAARYSVWNANCFPQALCAALLLRCARVPHIVYFGVRKGSEGQIEAHAWVAAGLRAVTGGGGHARFAVVGAFARP